MPDRFSNVNPAHRRHGPGAIFRWAVWDRLRGRRRIAPPGPAARWVAADSKWIGEPSGPPRVTWIGHASFLLTLEGACCLIDPVFSERIGMFYPRFVPPGLLPEALPELEAVLISHNHYDHLDAPSVAALPRHLPVITPLRLGRWFRRRGFQCVVELDWWQATQAGPLHVTLVPSRHWSRRGLWDVNDTLWGGFVVRAGDRAIYHAGDSGWFEGFEEIGRRFPDLLAALVPIGAYNPAWFMEPNHLNPEQAGRAFVALGAQHLVPMHWGTFQMTDEPLSEPIERLQQWWQQHPPAPGRRLHVPAVGETLVLQS